MYDSAQSVPRAQLYPMDDHFNLHLLTMGNAWLGTWWKQTEPRTTFWRIWRNETAGAVIRAEGEDVPMMPGRLYVVPSQIRIHYRAEAVVRHFYLHFDVVGISRTLLHTTFPNVLVLEPPPRLATLLRAVRSHEPPNPLTRAPQAAESAGEFRALCLAKELMYAVWRDLIETLPAEKARHFNRVASAAESVRAAVEYIDANLAEPMSINLLADECNMSRGAFIAAFRRSLGRTPAQYVLDRRLEAAAEMLAYGQQSIEAIAAASGFANRYYFTRMFARRHGIAPAKYRRAAWDRWDN